MTSLTAVRALTPILVMTLLLSSCGLLSSDVAVAGWPEVDLGAQVEVYKSTPERDLHLHFFRPEAIAGDSPGAVLFFHGGGFRTTRVEQFERQAKAVAEAGMVGIVAEYRVTAEGTTRADAVADGADALAVVRANADRFALDPGRIALAGSSAGGALVVEATAVQLPADALVLFNPAVGAASAQFVVDEPTIVFHSREDTIVPFSSAEAFCIGVTDCELVAFEEGDHGFFNDDPAFTATTTQMIEFLSTHGW
jgi:alpha-beta hydrolase superfamily lysophospholipase